MFRVVGRDAQGNSRELSISASTEQEARELAQGAGLVTVDNVSIPSPSQSSRFPKPSGFTVGCLGCLACVGSVIVGAVIGAFTGSELEPAGHVLKTQWLTGAIIGAIGGLVCGGGILAGFYLHYRDRK